MYLKQRHTFLKVVLHFFNDKLFSNDIYILIRTRTGDNSVSFIRKRFEIQLNLPGDLGGFGNVG